MLMLEDDNMELSSYSLSCRSVTGFHGHFFCLLQSLESILCLSFTYTIPGLFEREKMEEIFIWNCQLVNEPA